MESSKLVWLILAFFLLLPTVSAIEPTSIFRQGEDANLLFSCTQPNGLPCDSAFTCNITIQYPNSSLLLDNQQATHNPSYYNISLPNTDTLGFHSYQSFCTNGTSAGTSDNLYYLINIQGEEFTTGKGILYIFIMLISLALFFLCLYGALKIPWDNKRDDDGFIVGMNDLKYVKLFLWFMSYLLLMYLAFLTTGVSKFLEMNIASNFFNMIYLFLLVGIFPVFVLTAVFGFVRFFNDKKNLRLLERNLKPR